MTIEEQLKEATDKVEALTVKLKAANTESGERRETIKGMQKTIDGFDGVDMEKYKAAITTADAAKNDKLAHEGKVDEIRTSVEGEYKDIISKANKNGDFWKGKFQSEAVDNNLLSAAAAHKAIDPAAVVKLLRDQVDIDDDAHITVKNSKGETARNDTGDMMDIPTFVGTFLKDNPYMQQAEGGGSGSQGGDEGGASPEGSVAKIAAGLAKLQKTG